MSEPITKPRVSAAAKIVLVLAAAAVLLAVFALLKNIPGSKKIIYPQIDFPLTAIEDFRKLGKNDALFSQLADVCSSHGGLWNSEAESILLKHFEK